jgi:outer membrane protein assembly factor BamB
MGAGAAPAISGNVMVIPIGPALVRIDLSDLDSSYDLDWRYETGTTITAAPVIADEKVYFGDGAGVLHVLDLATRELLWQWDTGSRIVSSPLVMNGVVIVTSTNGMVVAIGEGTPVQPVTTEPSGGTDTTTATTAGETTTTTQGGDVTTTTREPVVTTLIPPTGVGGAQ